MNVFLHIWVCSMYIEVPSEIIKGWWNWTYRWFWASVGMLGTEHKSERAAYALSLLAIWRIF